MTVSRNPREFLERAGLLTALPASKPRLNLTALLISRMPESTYVPEQLPLLNFEGEQPPDRGAAKPWPNQV